MSEGRMGEWLGAAACVEPFGVQRLPGVDTPSCSHGVWGVLQGPQSWGGWRRPAGGEGGLALGPQRPSVSSAPDSSRERLEACGHSVGLVLALLSGQAQLIHDRNTAAHSVVATRTQAPSTPDKVQMTWTKEKLIAEKYKNKEPGVSGFKDLFSLKP